MTKPAKLQFALICTKFGLREFLGSLNKNMNIFKIHDGGPITKLIYPPYGNSLKLTCPPYWVRHLRFSKSDIELAITDPQKP